MDYPKDLIPAEYVPHALAVGALCNAWAVLETTTKMLLLKASTMTPSKLTFGIIHCFDFRDCLSAIKLAVIEAKWQAEVTTEAIACLNYIDSTLRVRRNRFVHDMWIYDEQTEAMNRFDNTPRTFKTQAFKPLDWTALSISDDKPEDIWATTLEIGAHSDELAAMQPIFNGTPGAGEALLKARPQRQFLHPQPEKQRSEAPAPLGKLSQPES